MSLKFGFYKNNQQIVDLADKVRIRDYVKRCGLGSMSKGETTLPIGYKFFALNGRVECILVVAGREKGEGKIRRFLTDRDFKLVNICREKKQAGFNWQSLKPSCLKEMIETAEKLSEPFPFVRVDLYNNNGNILFGEMTFTLMGCVNGY